MKKFHDRLADLGDAMGVPNFVMDAAVDYATRLPYAALFWEDTHVCMSALAMLSLASKILLDMDASDEVMRKVRRRMHILGECLLVWEMKIAQLLDWKLHFEKL